MKNHDRILLSFLATLLMLTANSWAADILISSEITGTQLYDSAEGIVFDDAILKPASNVTAVSTYEAVLMPGTCIESGARLIVRLKDMDGLSNRWELDHCQTLDHGPTDDPDSDELSMASELQAGTDPCNSDTDADGLPDGWEQQHGHDPLVNDASDDRDGDGLSDLGEYQAGTDINNSDTDNDGIPDGWEVSYGTNPLTDDAAADADGDGFSNLFEYNLGSAPNDPNSRPAAYLFNYDDNGNLDLMTTQP